MERVLFFLLLVCLLKAEQRILLDSSKESMLDWFKYPKGPESPTPGWVEESFTKIDKGINWRSYVVCDVGYPNVSNWLWTPLMERGDANRIYIEIKFSLRNCNLFPGTADQCKESFSLLSYEFDSVNPWQTPTWEFEAYTNIDRIGANEGMITNSNGVIINTVTRSVEVSKKGIWVIFRDQGACLSLLAVKVYYKTCPEVKAAFAQYPETPAGKTEAAIVKRNGVCVANSIPMDDKPYSFCKSDGTWLFSHQGGCQCKAGYQGATGGGGEEVCDICPPYSKSLFAGSAECHCNKGYYRAPSDPKTVACTRPPSEPRNLTLNKVDTTTVSLSWSVPRENWPKTMYRISCKKCGTGVRFTPDTETFPQTFISIDNLSPGTAYRFEVYSVNRVSSIAGEPPKSAAIMVTTEPAKDNAVTTVFVKNMRPVNIGMGWRSASDPDIEIEMYEVKYFISGPQKDKGEWRTYNTTRSEELLMSNLSKKTKYGFQVRAKRVGGVWGEFTTPVFTTEKEMLLNILFAVIPN